MRAESQFISLSAAARRFGPSVSSLKSRIRCGDLAAVRYTPKGKIYVDPAEVRRLAIAIQPEPPINQQELRDRMDQIATRVLGEGWRKKYRLQRKTETVH